ncbi:MAG: CDP-diacylglycerol O-phosphatidyltransferase [Bacteroidetes bacterium]|nr:CDP-diacylglycerol O-phosphatidyltransferase [Bacteroidota bacterium]
MKKHIPNFITLVNLFCGCCALLAVFYNQFLTAFWLLVAGGMADYADGLIARWLRVDSTLGKELDSLADMVTFGVVPGAILYMLLTIGLSPSHTPSFQLELLALPGFIVSVFAGLRLGKFNIDTRQHDTFIGLPTPSLTMFVTGLMLIYHFDSFGWGSTMINPWFLYIVIVLFSFLVVAELPMFSFKLKNFKWKGNEVKFSFAIISILMIILLKEAAFSLIISLYLLISVTQFLILKTRRKEIQSQ